MVVIERLNPLIRPRKIQVKMFLSVLRGARQILYSHSYFNPMSNCPFCPKTCKTNPMYSYSYFSLMSNCPLSQDTQDKFVICSKLLKLISFLSQRIPISIQSYALLSFHLNNSVIKHSTVGTSISYFVFYVYLAFLS